VADFTARLARAWGHAHPDHYAWTFSAKTGTPFKAARFSAGSVLGRSCQSTLGRSMGRAPFSNAIVRPVSGRCPISKAAI